MYTYHNLKSKPYCFIQFRGYSCMIRLCTYYNNLPYRSNKNFETVYIYGNKIYFSSCKSLYYDSPGKFLHT